MYVCILYSSHHFGPDHVQMAKVNWKNIQKYFAIFNLLG